MPRKARRAALALTMLAASAAVAGPGVAASGLIGAAAGQIVTFAANPDLGAIAMPVTRTRSGPTLLLSDAPEIVPGPGILYQDDVNGAFRLFFDHVDGATGAGGLVFSVLATNRGSAPATVSVQRVGSAGPSSDYFATGQAAQGAWMTSQGQPPVTVAPGQTVFLLLPGGGASAGPSQDVTGIIDGTTTADVQLSVVAQTVAEPSLAGLSILPAPLDPTGFALRGTFPEADVTITAQADGALQRLDMANPLDYLRGYSAVDNLAPAEDYGNYGVLYNVMVMTMGGAGPLAAVFDPQGGPFAGTALVGTGFGLGAPVLLPAGGTFAPSPLASILMGQFTLQRDVPLLLHFEWMPPGGSFLPTSIVLSPD